jgi:hypothetical protein
MNKIGLMLAAVLLVGISTEAVASPPAWHKPCVRAFKEYANKPSHKAFAMSPVRTSMSVYCGMAWNGRTKAAAEAEAKKQCAHGSKSTVCYVTDSE